MNAKTTKPAKAYHHGDLRKALLEAAVHELEERGFEAFSLRGVAKRAGVSHAAPAHHFKDTNALLTALCTVASERLYHAMKDRQAVARKDPRSQFIASGMGYIDFAIGSPALFKLMFGSDRPDSDDPELVKKAREAFMVLVEDVARLRGFNPMEREDGRLDVAVAWSLVHGIAMLLIAGRLRVIDDMLQHDREKTLRRLVDRVLPKASA